MRGLAVVGTDTGVGKTVLAAALLAAAPPHVRYWKPVQTGDDDDTATVRRLARIDAGRAPAPAATFRAPCSPHHAARLEGRSVTLAEIAARAREIDRPGARWVLEGAGGLLVPLGPRELMAALWRLLDVPVLVAASTRLGAINHTLLTLRGLAAEGIRTLGVVLVGPDDEALDTALADHASAPVVGRLRTLSPLAPDGVRDAGLRLFEAPALREALAPPEARA